MPLIVSKGEGLETGRQKSLDANFIVKYLELGT